MSDSDDDMPPPLEDMTEQVVKSKQVREHKQPKSAQDDGEEVRLKPKANTVIQPTPSQPE